MNEKFKEKESMIQEIGMKFDEAVELFSEETLASMAMSNIIDGDSNTNCVQDMCDPNWININCIQNQCGCTGGSSGGFGTGNFCM